MGALAGRAFAAARVLAAVAVTAVVWGWAAGQYPYVLQPGLTIEDAAAARPTLVAMTVTLLAGAVLLVPSLVLLFSLFQRTAPADRKDAWQITH
jgi:cytochrome d ubiquinol oxidase subunit II